MKRRTPKIWAWIWIRGLWSSYLLLSCERVGMKRQRRWNTIISFSTRQMDKYADFKSAHELGFGVYEILGTHSKASL